MAVLAGLLALPAAAGPVNWAHQAGAVQGNGAVVVKSLSGSSYTGTGNPTGAVAKANQNASTQPPTVIIQATATGPRYAVTDTGYSGNVGGKSGGDQKCTDEFGLGWKFATRGQVINIPPTTSTLPFWTYSALSCNGMSSSASNVYGHYWAFSLSSSGALYWQNGSNSCSSQMGLLCVSM